MNDHLKSQYGYNNFRECQKDVVTDILNKQNVIVIFPTGGGKSLCYQFPATFTNKISIVISPLLSLMSDQQLNLTEKGIKSLCLNSETKKSLLFKETYDYNVIYTTPEFLIKHLNIFESIKTNVCMFAIDEAHCISEWSADFRPSFKNLSILKEKFPDIPIMALTATATPRVLSDIFDILNLEEVNQYQLSSIRDNLTIKVFEKHKDIMHDLSIDPNESTVIYTQTRKKAEKIKDILDENGIDSELYHAGLSTSERDTAHMNFITDKTKVIVATICFGMGIDKPDIRKVINYGAPANLETYYQEIGRAGRDGMPSTVILYYDKSDYITNTFLFNKSSDKEYRKTLLDVFYQYITNTITCRQVMIEHYFNNGNLSGKISGKKCGKCDNCTSLTPCTNYMKEAYLVLNLVASLPFNYGIVKLINILRGINKDQIDSNFYGSGKEYSIDFWKKMIEYLVNDDYLRRFTTKKYTVIGLGENVINNKCKILLKDDLHPVDLIDKKYRAIRTTIAKENNISPYMIINDKVLENISRVKPETFDQLLAIDGISTEFVSKYGIFFISPKQYSIDSKTESFNMYISGKSISEIAKLRNLKTITIENHLIEKYKEDLSKIDEKKADVTDNMKNLVKNAVDKVGKNKLKPIRDLVGKKISYFQIRLCLLVI